jgi:hypothetical protein
VNPPKPPAVNRSPPPPPPPLPSAPPNPSLLPGIIFGSAIAIGGLTLAGVIVVVALFMRGNDRHGPAPPGPVLPPAAADREQAAAADMPAGPTSEEIAREEARKRKESIQAARRKLVAAGGDRAGEIRAAAEKLQEEIERLRKGSDTEPGLRIRPDEGGDPREAVQQAIAGANRADEARRLTDDAPSLLPDLDAAATELAAAVAALDAAKQQVPALAAAERQARKDAMERNQADDLANRRLATFAAFAKAASLVVELPARDGADPTAVGSVRRQKSEVDLGPFPVKDLVEPSLRLAVPEETINGVPFAAEIVPVADDRWEIRSTKGYTGLDGKPQTFAGLMVVDGLLRLEVEPKVMDKRPVAILRRCVILAEANDPQTKQPRAREIRLLKPTKVGALPVAAAAGRQEMRIPVPVGIFSKDTPPGGTTAVDLALPVSGIEVTGQWGDEKMTKRLPKEAAAPDQPGIVAWPGVSLGPIGAGVELELKVELSLPQATLVATPTLAGPNSQGIDLKNLVEFAEKRASSLPDVKKEFATRIAKCPGRDFTQARRSMAAAEGVNKWFTKPLATAAVMGLDLPGHETIQSSMNAYLQSEYRRRQDEERTKRERAVVGEIDAVEKRRQQAQQPVNPDVPVDFTDWVRRCTQSRDAAQWNQEFNARLTAWSEWFWPLFEAQWKTTEMQVTRPMQKQDLRLIEIVSMARDAEGNEYRVPLVEFDAAAPVTRGRVASDRDARGAPPLRGAGL